MSFIQKLFKAILPGKSAASMGAESRAWMMQCPDCGHEMSVWEMGGIRWGAAGKPRQYLRCPQCGKRSWHKVYSKSEDPAPQE